LTFSRKPHLNPDGSKLIAYFRHYVETKCTILPVSGRGILLKQNYECFKAVLILAGSWPIFPNGNSCFCFLS